MLSTEALKRMGRYLLKFPRLIYKFNFQNTIMRNASKTPRI